MQLAEILKTNRLILLVALILVSCNKDKFDFNKLKDLELQPEFWLPFGEVYLKLSDIKVDSSLISTDPNGFVTIVLRKDSILRNHFRSLLHIPEQDTAYLEVPTGQPLTSDMTIRVFNNAEIEKIYFDTLSVAWMLPSGAPSNTEIAIQFPGSYHQSGTIQFSIDNVTHTPGQYYVSTFYNGYIDLSKNGTSFNTLSYTLNILQVPPQTPAGTPIPCALTIDKIAIAGMEGYLGNSILELPLFTNELKLRGLEKFNQGINFRNPSLTVTVFNESGLELYYDPNIIGANNKNSELTALEVPSIYINKSQSPGQSSLTQITLNNSNSNLSDVLRRMPENLVTSGTLTVNPNGKQPNFLRKNDEIILSGLFEIPLEFSAKNMYFETEFANFNFWKNSNNIPEYIEFEFNSENGFPFDLSLNVVFLDSLTLIPIKDFELDILQSAKINSDGRVISSKNYKSLLKLKEDDISSISRAKSLLLKIQINTPEDGEKVVKIFDEYYFNTKIIVRSKFKFTPLQ